MLFTSCPNCLKQFRIEIPQLSAASGTVICGACNARFNALSHISEKPLTIDEINQQSHTTPQPESDNAISPPKNIETQEKIGIETQVSDELTDTGKFSDGGPEDIARELLHYSEQQRSGWITFCWVLGIFLLLTTMLGQVAWFNRDIILTHYPQLAPITHKICDQLHCSVIRHKNINAIKLVNRDIRKHPVYKNALLVNATINNESNTVQPFPLMQLALFNRVGEIISYGEFKPAEYLNNLVPYQTMQPKSATHFVLELGTITTDAVNFEFNFL